jgi:hypothetical protein
MFGMFLVVVAGWEGRTEWSGCYWCLRLCFGASRRAELASRCRSRCTGSGRGRICGGGIAMASLGLGGWSGEGGV